MSKYRDNFIIDDQSFNKNLYLLDKMSASGCVLEENYDDFKILCQPIQFHRKICIFKCFVNHRHENGDESVTTTISYSYLFARSFENTFD